MDAVDQEIGKLATALKEVLVLLENMEDRNPQLN
jgi:hypothetical protein